MAEMKTHMSNYQPSNSEPEIRISAIRPQIIVEVHDEQIGRLGYLVIDRILGDASIGGVRFAPGVSVEEVANLARAMTLKCSFFHLGVGGAKAGIIAPSSLGSISKEEILAAFGKNVGPILRSGIYIPGEDIGVSGNDLNVIRQAAGLPAVKSEIDGAYFTALTVFETIKQSLKTKKASLKGTTIAIEGFGKVGSNLAKLLEDGGAIIIAVSTFEGAIYQVSGLNVEQLLGLRKTHGDSFVFHVSGVKNIGLSELLHLDVDVLVPCARAWSITAKVASNLQSDFVIPGANIPATPQAEQIMFERGILFVPGFVANCGALLAGSLVAQGFRNGDIHDVITHEFAWKVAHFLEQAQKNNRMPAEIAREIAWQNYRHMTQEFADEDKGVRSLFRKTFRKGVKASIQRGASILYRRGLLRWDLVRRLALADIKKYYALTNNGSR